MNSSRGACRSFSSSMTPRRQARVLVIGSGRMGHIRSSLLYANPRFELAGIVDVNEEAATPLAQTYGVNVFHSLQHGIDNQRTNKLDGIVVSSPTFTHEQVITEAAKFGLNVFTEKPVDETAQKIQKLFSVAQDGNIHLCCGFQRRFDTSYIAAANAVREGQVGRPLAANIFFGDHPGPPKQFLLGGGCLFMDLSAHDVDYIMHALDDEVASVYATGTSSCTELEAAGVHDNATMCMNFSKGAVVTLFMSRSSTYGYDQRCEVFGTLGKITVENEHAHQAVLSNAKGVHHAKMRHSFPQRFEQAFRTELDAFCDTLLNDAPWPITAQQCIKVQKVADAARLSCDTNQVVEIDYDVVATESLPDPVVVTSV